MGKTFLTTTLPYANSIPHIGHMFEFVMADAITRYRKLRHEEVFFNTGLDCHGTKIKQKADELGMDPHEYIKTLEPIWKEFCSKFDVNYDNFYLTSSAQHHTDVQLTWKYFLQRGDLYKKNYTGKYCVGCESFKLDKELVNGKCPDHPTLELEDVEEENYFFKLSEHKDSLLSWISNTPEFLKPESKLKELIHLINDAEDISVSRIKSKCPWGVPVPDDPEQVIYVWFDALLNYIFAAGHQNWKDKETKVIQICGPDNLRFQAVIFQAMLEAEGLKKTNELLVHGTIVDADGKKMSKTEGNVIDPIDQLNKFGLDAVRYYTLAGLSTYSNSSWDEKNLRLKYNSDICNSWGNFVSRVLHLMDTKCNGEYFSSMPPEFFYHLAEAEKEIIELWDKSEIKEALERTAALVAFGNKYINDNAPWNEKDPEKVKWILSNCYHLIWVVAKSYVPVFPGKTEMIDKALRERKKVILFERIP